MTLSIVHFDGGTFGDKVKKLKQLACVSALIVGSLIVAPSSALADSDAGAVFDHHLTAFIERNMQENLADYTEDSVVIIPNTIFRGKAEIEGLFGALFKEFAQEGSKFELTEKRVEGNIVYISWKASTPDNEYRYATDTFLIEDGKIKIQTIGLVVESK